MTNLTFRINKTDPNVAYGDTGGEANYTDVNLTLDYLVWTAGSDAVADGQDEPSQDELNQASTVIDADEDVTVAHCLLMDYDGQTGGLLREVEGMGENKQYVFCFSFDGALASEPQLEAWDDTNHNSTDKNVLGVQTGEDSFIKGKCTTLNPPGAGWDGDPIAGSSDVLLLNDGNGAPDTPDTGDTIDLYANLKIVIPQAYDTPAIESFTLTCRHRWF